MLGAFVSYLYRLTGSWTAWYTAQQTGWVRELTWPWESFWNTIPAISRRVRRPPVVGRGVPRPRSSSMAVGVAVVVWCLV